MQVDLDWLGFDEGGHLLVKRALQRSPVGEEIRVTGSTPELESHLRAWCRSEDMRSTGCRIACLIPTRSSPEAARRRRGGPAPNVPAHLALLKLKEW